MQLNDGTAAEYKARHDALWPELHALLKRAGISDYSIYLDPQSHALFAVLWRKIDHSMDTLPAEPIMQRWWDHMADIMVCGQDNAPIVVPLETVFHML